MITKEQVNQILKHSYNPEGVARWWVRPRYQLNDLTPEVAWALGMERQVYDLAEAGQGQIAT